MIIKLIVAFIIVWGFYFWLGCGRLTNGYYEKPPMFNWKGLLLSFGMTLLSFGLAFVFVKGMI